MIESGWQTLVGSKPELTVERRAITDLLLALGGCYGNEIGLAGHLDIHQEEDE